MPELSPCKLSLCTLFPRVKPLAKLKDTLDIHLPAVPAHAPAKMLPRAHGKRDVMVARRWPPKTTFDTANADMAPAEVDDFHGGVAVGAGMKRH